MPYNQNLASYPSTSPYKNSSRGRRRIPVSERIDRVYVPLGVLEATSQVMRRFGMQQRECYVWWGGSFVADGVAQVASAYCPDIPTDYGRIYLGVRDFHALHRELRARDQVLIVELHTHPPGAGGQNEVDAAHPAAPYPGFLTIVVPDFAAPFLHDLRNCYVYRYIGSSDWQQLDRDQIAEKFTIEESLVMVGT